MRKYAQFLLFLGILLVGCTVEEPQAVEANVPEAETLATVDETCYQSGTLYVKMSSDITTATKASNFEAITSSLGVVSIEPMFHDGGRFEERHKKYGLDKWYVVKYDPSVPHTKAEKGFDSFDGVEIVETPLNMVPMGGSNYFNDPYLSYQWHYYNDGALSKHKAGEDINVVPVWDEFTAGSKDIIVGVIDGGMDTAHPDLADVMVPAGPNGSWNFTTNKGRITAHDHGTHVSGTIAAINNNKIGVCGIAGGNDGTGGVKILNCQIFSRNDGQGNSADAIVWACDHGATIANNSWGYEFESDEQAHRAILPAAVKDAIDYFIDNAGLDEYGNQEGPMKGGVLFFSAGNGDKEYGNPLSYALPAAYEKVVAVSAYGPDGKPSWYTNYGEWVDLAAPGGESSISNGQILSTYPYAWSPNNPYSWFEGTSMACPHATGVAALILSYYGGPGFTNEDLKARLIYGARYNERNLPLAKYGPALDAYGAMTLNLEAGPEVSFADPELEKGISLKSHETKSILFNVSGNQYKKYIIDLVCSNPAVTYEVNDEGNVVVTIDALKTEPGTYSATVSAGYTTQKATNIDFNFTILPNHAPVVSTPISYVIIEKQGSKKNLDLGTYFSDEDGEILNYSYSITDENIVSPELKGAQLSLTAAQYGQTMASVTASDARKASVKQDFVLMVYNPANAPAVGPNPVVDVLNISKGAKHDMNVTIKSATGVTVYSGTVSGDYFNPAKIDLSSLAPGKYSLDVVVNKESFKSVIVKK